MPDPGTMPGRKIQIGRESTAGTEVAATRVLRGTGTLADAREWVDVEENIGILPMTTAAILTKTEGALEFEGPATAEQIGHILGAGIDADATGTQDGVGSGYIYTHSLPTDPASPGTPDAYTIESGDEAAVDVAKYGRVVGWGLQADESGHLVMTAQWVTRAKSTHAGGFSGSSVIPDVDYFIMGDVALYLDAIGGTVGTTQISDTLLALQVTGVTGWQPYYSGGGGADFAGLAMRGKPSIDLDLTLVHRAASRTVQDNFRNNTPQLLRLECLGATLATPGTAHTYKTIRIDAAGVWRDMVQLDESDGLAILRGRFSSRYHATPAYWGTITVVNELTTLPG